MTEETHITHMCTPKHQNDLFLTGKFISLEN